jgi:hypothetical protein
MVTICNVEVSAGPMRSAQGFCAWSFKFQAGRQPGGLSGASRILGRFRKGSRFWKSRGYRLKSLKNFFQRIHVTGASGHGDSKSCEEELGIQPRMNTDGHGFGMIIGRRGRRLYAADAHSCAVVLADGRRGDAGRNSG